jgi:two-component system, cell cycle sensor histidine kinase and response regulator CckA
VGLIRDPVAGVDIMVEAGSHILMRQAEFLDGFPVALFRSTLEGTIVYCNRCFAGLFGYDSVKALIGSPEVALYRNMKDRGYLVDCLLQQGRLYDIPIGFRKRDGSALSCAVTVRGVFDDDGMVVHVDGLLRDITTEIMYPQAPPPLDEGFDQLDDLLISASLQGDILNLNKAAGELFGVTKTQAPGKPLFQFFEPEDRQLLLVFFADVRKLGRGETILTVRDPQGQLRHLDWRAYLWNDGGRPHHVKLFGRDITGMVERQNRRVQGEKFQGALEMAGGVAHHLNQPLTIVNNLLNEMLDHASVEGPCFDQMIKVQQQVNRMIGITRKIATIKRYESMDYVAGVKIVDIEKSILTADGEDKA